MENRACSRPEEIFQSVQALYFFVPEGHRRLSGGETTGCDQKPPREPIRAENKFLRSLPVGACAPPPAIIHDTSGIKREKTAFKGRNSSQPHEISRLRLTLLSDSVLWQDSSVFGQCDALIE